MSSHRHELDAAASKDLSFASSGAGWLSRPEIARDLDVSPNTIKTQCSAIYRKLAVTSRHAAVQAAREQHLL